MQNQVIIFAHREVRENLCTQLGKSYDLEILIKIERERKLKDLTDIIWRNKNSFLF